MRAILGHLSEYNPEEDKVKNNLGKAYGHFRRLSIDTLKILCNGFDKEYDKWIGKHALYDYRGIDNEYFPKYVSLYNKAHAEYIRVQKLENLGSDRDNGIIKEYRSVAENYYILYQHHMDDRRIKIEKITKKFIINKIIWFLAAIFMVILSVLGNVL